MPIYEYRCSACGFEKDALQKMSDPRLVDCPQCGKPALVKLVSAAGFQLKGSGWYATDFKSSGKKPATTDKAEAPKADAGSTETASTDKAGSGDSKAAEKPAASSEVSKPAATPGSGD
ncbi:MAG: zinc ribbon domain-containing protein [Casimicrobiaceae bacterium]